MANDIVPHPQPILWVSVIVSICTFAFSMATFGRFSYWTLPIACGFSIIHNITLLILSAKDRKKLSEERNGTLTATSKKATIICTWFLLLLWMVATGLGIAGAIITRDEYEGRYFYIVPWFEFSFALVEIGVMGFLCVQCIRERRQIIGLANATNLASMVQ